MNPKLPKRPTSLSTTTSRDAHTPLPSRSAAGRPPRRRPPPEQLPPPPGPAWDPVVHRAAVILMNTYAQERTAFDNRMLGQQRQTPTPLWVPRLPPTPVADLWRSLARRLQAESIDPAVYVRRAFQYAKCPSRPPRPADIATAKAVGEFAGATRSITAGKLLELESAKGYFARKVAAAVRYDERFPDRRPPSPEEAWAAVLDEVDYHCGDPDAPLGDADYDYANYNGDGDLGHLSALFRHCMAFSISKEARTIDRKAFQEIADYFWQAAAMEYVRYADVYESTAWRKMLPPGIKVAATTFYRQVVGAVGVGA